jgi:hypothetical protein
VRFIVISDEGDRLGSVSFEGERADVDDLPDEALGMHIGERLRELHATGGYPEPEKLIHATLERVSADAGVRFVRDPADEP